MAIHCAAMVGFEGQGAEVFDYGNSLRGEAQLGGFEELTVIQGSRQRISGRSSARAKGLSGGPRSRPRSRT